MPLPKLPVLLLLAALPLCACAADPATPPPVATSQPAPDPGTQIDLTISGGHNTVGHDRGRPVILIAAALKVKPEVFRAAFDHVHPAGPNSGGPTDAEARTNKAALMGALAPYGVTDDRLNEVSNFYRYNRQQTALWRHTDATATATVLNGKITALTLTNPGAGYSSTPTLSIPGYPDTKVYVTLQYTTDFKTNGSIQSISLTPPPATQPAP